MDVLITDCPAPQYVGKTAHAIYELTGDSLTISAFEPGNPALPAGIGAPGSRTLVFKRN